MAETTIRLKPARRVAQASRGARWYSGWAPARAAAVLRAGVARGDAAHDRRADREARQRDAPARAGRAPGPRPARARMDMMSTGVRTPVGIRIVAADPARLDALGRRVRARRGGACPARAARSTNRSGGETRLRVRRRRGGAGAARRRRRRAPSDRRPVAHRRADRRGRARGRRDASGAHRCPTCRRAARGRRSSARGHRARRRQRRRGSRCRSRCSGGPLRQRARADPHRARRAGRLCLRRPRGRHRPRWATSSARSARWTRRRAGDVALGPGERIEWTGQYELLAAGPAAASRHRAARGAARCWPCCSCSSAADRGADRAGLGPVRAGRQLLDAVPARLSAVGAGLGRPAFGRRPGHADRRGHGRLHRRGVLSAGARGTAAQPRRHRRRARRGYGAAPAARRS